MSKENTPGLTHDEAISHFSLWAVMKAPLMIGCDLSTKRCRDSLPIFLNQVSQLVSIYACLLAVCLLLCLMY